MFLVSLHPPLLLYPFHKYCIYYVTYYIIYAIIYAATVSAGPLVAATSHRAAASFACVFAGDNADPPMPASDLVPAFGCITSLSGLVNFDEDPEEDALIACTYALSITGLFWSLGPRLICPLLQPRMQAFFHLPSLSPSIACDCEPGPPPPRGSGAICMNRLDDARRSPLAAHVRPGAAGVCVHATHEVKVLQNLKCLCVIHGFRVS